MSPGLGDMLPQPPWDGPPIPRGVFRREISPECDQIAFIVDTVYQEAVELGYDLLNERLEDAGRRMANLSDMMPQVYGLTHLTTKEEREDLARALARVESYVREGDTVMAYGAADEFSASFRHVLWNIIVRCESLV